MKLSDYRKDYYYFSGKASDVARQLAFAGIALVWIFKIGGAATPSPPHKLILPTGLLALSLAADLLHYIASTLIWGSFHRYHERRLKNKKQNPELTASPRLNWPALFLFWIKLVAVIFAYILIIIYIWQIWVDT